VQRQPHPPTSVVSHRSRIDVKGGV
jgi:hypothetical protein